MPICGFQYAFIRNNQSKKFGIEYWALPGSNSPWRPRGNQWVMTSDIGSSSMTDSDLRQHTQQCRAAPRQKSKQMQPEPMSSTVNYPAYFTRIHHCFYKLKFIYRTCAIITRGLYTFYPLLKFIYVL